MVCQYRSGFIKVRRASGDGNDDDVVYKRVYVEPGSMGCVRLVALALFEVAAPNYVILLGSVVFGVIAAVIQSKRRND